MRELEAKATKEVERKLSRDLVQEEEEQLMEERKKRKEDKKKKEAAQKKAIEQKIKEVKGGILETSAALFQSDHKSLEE